MAAPDGNSTRFLASFPPIQSAIKVYGDKQGMRVQLDIPESEMAAAMALFLWRDRVLCVTVEPEAEDDRQGTNRRRELHI